MYSTTDLSSPDFKSLPQKYKIQLELKDHLINKLQNQLNDITEDLLQTKAMLSLVKDQFLSLLKKIVQDRKKFPETLIRTQLINDYVLNLSKLRTNQNPQINASSRGDANHSSSSNINRHPNLMNNSYSAYLSNSQNSFAFSSRYNSLMEEHLNNLYRRGKFKENSLWLSFNNDSRKSNIGNSNNYKPYNSFYISSCPSNNIYKRKNCDLENSFSSRKSLNQSDIRNLSEIRKEQRGKVGAAYENFSNRSYSSKGYNRGLSCNVYGYPINKGGKMQRFDINDNQNIHVNVSNQKGNKRRINYINK